MKLTFKTINLTLPFVKQLLIQRKTFNNDIEESIILRNAQYIPIPDVWITLEWAISQIESSLFILKQKTNDKFERSWISQQIETLNE